MPVPEHGRAELQLQGCQGGIRRQPGDLVSLLSTLSPSLSSPADRLLILYAVLKDPIPKLSGAPILRVAPATAPSSVLFRMMAMLSCTRASPFGPRTRTSQPPPRDDEDCGDVATSTCVTIRTHQREDELEGVPSQQRVGVKKGIFFRHGSSHNSR